MFRSTCIWLSQRIYTCRHPFHITSVWFSFLPVFSLSSPTSIGWLYCWPLVIKLFICKFCFYNNRIRRTHFRFRYKICTSITHRRTIVNAIENGISWVWTVIKFWNRSRNGFWFKCSSPSILEFVVWIALSYITDEFVPAIHVTNSILIR